MYFDKSSSFIIGRPTGDCGWDHPVQQEKALQLQSLEEAVLEIWGDWWWLMVIYPLVIYG